MALSPFPFHTLPRLIASDLALCNAAAGWLGGGSGRGSGASVVLGVAAADWRLVAVGRREPDAGAGLAWLVRDGARVLVSLPGDVVRAVARRLLAAPLELEAPRPLTSAEHAVAAMLCASALEEWEELEKEGAAEAAEEREGGKRPGGGGDVAPGAADPLEVRPPGGGRDDGDGRRGPAVERVVARRGAAVVVTGRSVTVTPLREVASSDMAGSAAALDPWRACSVEVWQPVPEVRTALAQTSQRVSGWPCLELAVRLDGKERVVRVWVPPQLAHLRPSRAVRRGLASSAFASIVQELPVVMAAAPLEPEALARLSPRDVIIVAAPERGAELRVGRGAIGVRLVAGSGHGPAHAVIESSYRRAVDPLSDDVTSELTVTLGAATLSLRQLGELAVGQVVPLGRPLGGPFELRVAGKLIGSGELVDVDGALGVRVLSLQP